MTTPPVADMMLGGIPLLELRRALTPTPPRPQIVKQIPKKAGETDMADSPWCKTSLVSKAGDMWTFTLALENLDELLTGAAIDPVPGATASAGACGGGASMGCVKAALSVWSGLSFPTPEGWRPCRARHAPPRGC